MLGRSAREKPSCDCGCEAALPNSRRCAKNKHRRCRLRPAKTTNSWPPRRHPSERPSTCCGSPQQAQGAIAMENAAEGAEQWFLLRMLLHLRLLEPCGPQPWPAQARKHPAVAGRAPQAASESQALCHSERSEESFPLRTKDRGRTMPRKEEKDKRSAVENLSTYTFIQILRRSSDLLRMTMLSLH